MRRRRTRRRTGRAAMKIMTSSNREEADVQGSGEDKADMQGSNKEEDDHVGTLPSPVRPLPKILTLHLATCATLDFCGR